MAPETPWMPRILLRGGVDGDSGGWHRVCPRLGVNLVIGRVFGGGPKDLMREKSEKGHNIK